MGVKKYYWLKLKNDFFTNKKIKKLRKIAGGDTYTIIYLKMQLLSITNEGKLYFENVEDSFADELALELDEDVENVKVTLMFLIKNGLLVEINGEEFLLPEAQDSIGKESASAERVRKHRELKQQKQLALQCNTEVTKSNTEIEIEKEIELDKELDIKKEEELKNNSPKTTTKRFIKPTLEEVKQYCKERNNKINAEYFIDYYEANGWKVGKNSMKDWKAAIRNWERRENTTTNTKKPIREEIVPDWFNKKVEKEEASPEEIAEMEELLREFKEPQEYKPNPELQQRLKEKYGKKQNV